MSPTQLQIPLSQNHHFLRDLFCAGNSYFCARSSPCQQHAGLAPTHLPSRRQINKIPGGIREFADGHDRLTFAEVGQHPCSVYLLWVWPYNGTTSARTVCLCVCSLTQNITISLSRVLYACVSPLVCVCTAHATCAPSMCSTLLRNIKLVFYFAQQSDISKFTQLKNALRILYSTHQDTDRNNTWGCGRWEGDSCPLVVFRVQNARQILIFPQPFITTCTWHVCMFCRSQAKFICGVKLNNVAIMRNIPATISSEVTVTVTCETSVVRTGSSSSSETASW